MQQLSPSVRFPRVSNFVAKSLAVSFIATTAFAVKTFAQAPAPAAAGNGDFYEFVNATGGAFTDAQISWSFDQKTWHPLSEGKSAPAKLGGGGRINFRLSNDKGTWQDFIEYTHNNNWNGNTTYVDAFVIPLTIELFKNDGSSVKLGIDQSRKALFDLFKQQAPPEFQSCVVTDPKTGEFKRIASPFQVDFGPGKPQNHYFDKYVDEIWDMYAQPKTLPSGWTGKVENGVLTLSKPGGKTYTLTRKPTTQEILLGQAEMGKSADMCSAFNRHVFADPADWSDPSKYYKTLPYNFYAKFWHEHTVDGKAYGFCYDDYAGQASYISAPGKKLVVTLYWDASPPATMPKSK
ncbi:MAG TPA: beta-1,3-glucanase family protein [Chthoniobacteraceae bacterium]|nr:beta-1,3-glucanase family protein [Chthoniobacteraceae bacterium]